MFTDDKFFAKLKLTHMVFIKQSEKSTELHNWCHGRRKDFFQGRQMW